MEHSILQLAGVILLLRHLLLESHDLVDAEVGIFVLGKSFDLGDVVAVVDGVQALDWQELLFVKVVFVEEHLLGVIRVVEDHLRKHIAGLTILELDSALILNENAQLCRVDNAVHLQQPVLGIAVKVYLQLILVLEGVVGQE